MSHGSFIDPDRFDSAIQQPDLQIVASIISELTGVLHHQNNSKSKSVTKELENFIENDLLDYWDSIISLNSPSRILQKELQNFYTEIYTFIAKLNLPIKYLEKLNESLKGYRASLAKLNPLNISAERRNELMKFNLATSKEGFIKDKCPNISQLGMHQIIELIQTPFLRKAKQLIEDKQITAQQISELIKMFNQIQPFLNPVYATLLLQMLAEGIINIIPLDTSAAPIMCPFLSSNAKSMPEMTDQLLRSLTSIDISLNVQSEFLIVDCVCKIVQLNGLKNSALNVKNELIRASKSKNSALTSLALTNLTKISDRTPFDLNDITELLSASTKCDGTEHLVTITNLLPLVKDLPDTFAIEYLQTGKLYPPLDCALIDRTKKDKLRQELFDHATSNIQVLQSIDFATIKQCRYIWKQLYNALHLNISIDKFNAVTCFLLANPNCEATPVYLKKAIQVARMNPAIINSLLQFSKVIEFIDISSVYFTLLDETIASIASEISSVTSGLFTVLSNWTETYKKLKSEEVIDKLMKVDFVQFPLEMPHFIDVITSRLSDAKYVVPLLMKFVNITIPEIHAHWLVHSLFRQIYDNEQMMDDFVAALMAHFETNKSRNTAVLHAAACLEADFFRIDGEFGLVQSIKFSLEANTSVSQHISFHPFHSARRLYYAAGRALNFLSNQLALYYNDGYSDIMFQFNSPLTSLHLGSKPIIEFRAEKLRAPVDVSYIIGIDYEQVVKCQFLNRLKTPENLNILFSQISSFDDISQRIFLVMMLFEPFENLPRCSHPLQHVMTNTVRDAMALTQASRVFPYVLRSAASSVKQFTKDGLKQVVDILTAESLDTVSLAIACQILPFFNVTEIFSSTDLKKILLDCDQVLVRKAIIPLISRDTPPEAFISLLPLTIQGQYRAKSNEFFEAMSKFDIPETVYCQIYGDMKQFEISHYYDIDQTFISLMKLVPKTDEMFELTIKRLFAPPTCSNLNAPFVHTVEAFGAGLEFIRTEKAVPYLMERLRSLPNCPRPHIDLSDDFTYKGRCGINNLGSTCYASSIIQAMTTIPTLVSEILKLTIEQLQTPFLINFRSLLAQNIYARGSILNVRGMMEDMKDFNPYMQEDAGEFLNTLLNSIKDTVSGGENILNLLTGEELEGFYTTDGRLISEKKKTFSQLQLVTEGMSNLYESFDKNFREEVMHDYKINDVTGERADVIRRSVITRWPDYLTLTLARWKFELESATYTKLTHEFDFPMVLQGHYLERTTGSNPGTNYNLTAVILHTGTTDNGHYTAIVEGDDGEWYICDDESVNYFSQAQIPSWSFGGIENIDEKGRIMTAYLLLYRRCDVKPVYPSVPKDLEPTIDEQNANTWPSIIFYSPQFIDFVRKLLKENPDDYNIIEFATIVLFKISVPNPKILESFCKQMVETITVSESMCETFCDIIDRSIGDALQNLLCYSELSFKYLSPLIISAVERVTSTTRCVHELLKAVNLSTTKRCAMLAHELIATALRRCVNVDWTNEDEVLLLMVVNLVTDNTKESQKPTGYVYYMAINLISQILLEISEIKINDAMLKLYEPQSVLQIVSIARRSESFIGLLTSVAAQKPDVLEELKEIEKNNKEVHLLLVSVAANSASIGEEIPKANLDFLWSSIYYLIFHDTKETRQTILNSAVKLLKTPDKRAIDFIAHAILDEKLAPPPFYDGSSLVYYFVGLIPHIAQRMASAKNVKSENTNIEALTMVIHASLFSPGSIIPFFASINTMLVNCQSQKVNLLLSTIVHHVLAFDRDLKANMSPEAISKILSLENPTEEIMQLLNVFRDECSETNVLSAAVSYTLSLKVSPFGSMIADIVSTVKVANYVVPKTVDSMENIRLGIALLDQESNKTKRNELLDYLAGALTYARPIKLFMHTKTCGRAIEILKEERPDRLKLILDV